MFSLENCKGLCLEWSDWLYEYRLGMKWLNSGFHLEDLSVTEDMKLNVSPKYIFTEDIEKCILSYIRMRRTSKLRGISIPLILVLERSHQK